MCSTAIILSHDLRFLSETLKVCENFDIFKTFQLVKLNNSEIGLIDQYIFSYETGSDPLYEILVLI